ncbi:hypothetical protein B296_00004909 [Ensete ventricosum]|uniref:Protein kinase domain-containing protein n=1 Tax=Ensete ventricosum TaxID=4639 RepID=A0A426ZW04_ENSVE|nr:hypothetical protein B296_00004909 [Ensete ventricosum]
MPASVQTVRASTPPVVLDTSVNVKAATKATPISKMDAKVHYLSWSLLHPNLYPCHGKCNNTVGGYECSCPPGTHDNAFNGTCTPNQKLPLAVKIVTEPSTACYSCYVYKQRKRHNEAYFLLLNDDSDPFDKVTNRFDNNRVLGRGGYGTVYRGVLEDNHIIAVKKPKMINESNKNEFEKEMFILSQINHKNIVKLLGCCLEVEVPMLVCEFIPNGTLFHLIHEHAKTSPIPLGTRLRIAYESADALAYLHSSASPPIIHGDVKSSNILLDENYMAKVPDFGASKLVPKDEDQFATLVQGTCGYLDPEYLQTCQLTDKKRCL